MYWMLSVSFLVVTELAACLLSLCIEEVAEFYFVFNLPYVKKDSYSSRCLRFSKSLGNPKQPQLLKSLTYLPLPLAILNLLFSFAHATPTPLASQASSSSNNFPLKAQPPTTQPLP